MLRLCTAANLPEAYLLLHRLAQAGIEARVLNEHAQGGLGEIPFTHAYPEIWIMEAADEERARRRRRARVLGESARPRGHAALNRAQPCTPHGRRLRALRHGAARYRRVDWRLWSDPH